MKSLRKYIFVVVLVLVAVSARAQYSYFGDEPSSVKWRSVQGAEYSVIYPEGFDSLAFRYLDLFDNAKDEASRGLGLESIGLPVVLHPYSLTNKSQVSWAPKRIDIATTPSNNAYALNWDVSQAVTQNRLNGVMKFFTQGDFVPFRLLLGDQSVFFGDNINPSNSLFRGDANLLLGDWFDNGPVSNANWSMYYRAAFLSGDVRSSDAWRYGSYRHYTPPSEVSGFIIAGAMRRYSGNLNFLRDILFYETNHWWHFLSKWNIAYQRGVGKTRRKLWRQEFVPEISRMWLRDDLRRGAKTPYTDLAEDFGGRYIEFSDFRIAGGENFALRKGMEYENQLVTITNGKTHRISAFSKNSSDLSSQGEKLYWSEIVPDKRWSAVHYSIIRSYDTSTGRKEDITSKTRYFAPKVADTDTIVAVDGAEAVVILDGKGNEYWRRSFAGEEMEIREAIKFGDRIYFTAVTMDGCGLYSMPIDDVSAVISYEIRPQSQMIEHLSIETVDDSQKIAFTSDYDDIINAYCYDAATHTAVRLTNSKFGVAPLTVNDDMAYYGIYDNFGMHPVTTPLKDLRRDTVDFEKAQPHILKEFFAQTATPLEPTGRLKSEEISITRVPEGLFDRKEYVSKPYNKLANGLHIHSWVPFYASVDRISDMSFDNLYQLVSPGATLLMQNVLGTFTAQIGYAAHPEKYFLERLIDGDDSKGGKWFHSAHLNLKYSGLYPVLEANIDFNDRYSRSVVVSDDYYGNPVLKIENREKPYFNASFKTYLPLNLSKGGWNSGFVPYAEAEIANDYYSFENAKFRYNQFNVKAGARYYTATDIPKSRLMPRWGFGADAYFKLANGIHNDYGQLVKLHTYAYLSGLTAAQGVKITADGQYYLNYDANVYMWDNAKAPRGYRDIHLGNYVSASVDYGIPVYLGDVTWPWLYYLQRLQFIPFFDVAVNDAPGVVILKDSKFYTKKKDVVLRCRRSDRCPYSQDRQSAQFRCAICTDRRG